MEEKSRKVFPRRTGKQPPSLGLLLRNVNLPALQTVFDDLLQAAIFRTVDDQNGVFLPSDRPIQRLGLALEPLPSLARWLTATRPDALFLHRPWRLTDEQRTLLEHEQIGVLAYHLAFDERLTTGFNPTLAEVCGWGSPTLLGEKEGRPLGMACTLPRPQSFDELIAVLEREFGGPLPVQPPRLPPDFAGHPVIRKVAVVGAMNDALVRAAHAAGVDAYVTGQFRQPARLAVEATGLGVVELGHHRSEIWGLCTLARLLRTQLPTLEILLPEPL